MASYRASRLGFRPSLAAVESRLCLDATTSQIVPGVPDPADVLQSPTSTPMPTGEMIETVLTDVVNETTNLLQQGVDNAVDAATQAYYTLFGTTPTDPAPGPLTLTPPVTVVPDPVGPIASAPILPQAPPTSQPPALPPTDCPTTPSGPLAVPQGTANPTSLTPPLTLTAPATSTLVVTSPYASDSGMDCYL